MSAIPERVRRLIWARANDQCERCGMHLVRNSSWHSLQHRLARGMGGSSLPWINEPVNLALVCGSATSPGMCHEELESNRNRAKNLAEGWVIPKLGNIHPARIPILLWDQRLVFLNFAGGYSVLPDLEVSA